MPIKKNSQRPASGPSPQTPAAQILAATVDSKDRYKRWCERYQKTLFGSVLLNLLLFVALIVAVVVKEPPKTLGVTNDFRVIELPALDQEYYTDARLAQWAMNCVPEVLGLDFDKWRKTIDVAQDIFSEHAFKRYIELLAEKGWIDMVEQRRLLIRCGVTAPAVIVKRWVEDGRRTWEIQMPITISIDSTQGSLKQNNYTVRLIVERCSPREHPRGVRVKIFQIV